MDPHWVWNEKYDIYDKFGSGIFLLCTPGKNTLYVANAEVNSQIVTRRNDFPKPLEMYKSISLFGDNVIATEGQLWRHHRKITSAPFTENNNHLVWQECLHQSKAMLMGWMRKDGTQKSSSTIDDLQEATLQLSLHIISKAGFGSRLLWRHEEMEQHGRIMPAPEGHSLTYKDALMGLVDNLIVVMIFPRWLLSRSPWKGIKDANETFVEWGKYMNDMYQEKKAEMVSGEKREGMDLMGALVHGAGITAESLGTNDVEKKPSDSKQMLSDDEILGNAWAFILAGHETTGGTLHFCMLYLAMHWHYQAQLQKDLDDIFGDRPVSAWDYDRDLPKLFNGFAGAVMNEELRLIPPVVGIPKSTPKGSPQPLTIDGKRVVVPGDCHITLDTPAVHRNPRYWPTTCGPDASPAEIAKDLDSFKPDRWLFPASAASSSNHIDNDAEVADEYGGPRGADTSATFFRPPRGAYIPFSEGARSCLGRRFAQIEVLAVLAVVFREYSIELAVDKWASDDEVAAMGEEARERTWRMAKGRAEGLLRDGMGTVITIQFRGGHVPFRFVKRGEERFRYD